MDSPQAPNDAPPELELVGGVWWWWTVFSLLAVLAFSFNIIFIIVTIRQRNSRDLRTFLTAVLVALAGIDIMEVNRLVVGIFKYLHQYLEFRIVYCSMEIFHTVGVALFLVMAASYLIFPCRDAPPLYYPASKCSGSLPQKILIPLCNLLAGGACCVIYFFPSLYQTIVDDENSLKASCVNLTRFVHLNGQDDPDLFWSDVYQTCILVVAVVVPFFMMPVSILIVSFRFCFRRQCCQMKYKQNVGELLCMTVIFLVQFGSFFAITFPSVDEMLGMNLNPPRVAVLWELTNLTIRPMIYFLCNPGVWDGLKQLCCGSYDKDEKARDGGQEELEQLTRVTERVSSI